MFIKEDLVLWVGKSTVEDEFITLRGHLLNGPEGGWEFNGNWFCYKNITNTITGILTNKIHITSNLFDQGSAFLLVSNKPRVLNQELIAGSNGFKKIFYGAVEFSPLEEVITDLKYRARLKGYSKGEGCWAFIPYHKNWHGILRLKQEKSRNNWTLTAYSNNLEKLDESSADSSIGHVNFI